MLVGGVAFQGVARHSGFAATIDHSAVYQMDGAFEGAIYFLRRVEGPEEKPVVGSDWPTDGTRGSLESALGGFDRDCLV